MYYDEDGCTVLEVGDSINITTSINEVQADGEPNLRLVPGDCGVIIALGDGAALIQFEHLVDPAWVNQWDLEHIEEY